MEREHGPAANESTGRSHRVRGRLRLVNATTVVALAVIGALAYAAGTFRNDQPPHWHPDEPSKVRQLIRGRWNFNHPHLLMTTTRLVLAPGSAEDWHDPADRAMRDLQVARAGRRASAGLAALTAVLLGAMTMVGFGRWTGLLAGLLVALSPPLVLRAHYLKEDTALVMGLAVLGLGVAAMDRWPGAGSAAVLGIGAGLAASGKYVGALPAVVALAMILACRTDRPWSVRWRWQVTAVAACGLVFGMVNFEMVGDVPAFLNGLERGLDHARVLGHDSIRPVPFGAFYWLTLLQEVPLAVLLTAAVGMFGAAMERPRRLLGSWLIAAFPMAYLGMLALSRIGFGRYLLPVMVALAVLSAVGVRTCARCAGRSGMRARVATAVVLTAVVVVASVDRTARYLSAMGRDSRQRLAQWVVSELPPTRMVQDRYAALDLRQLARHGHVLRTERSVLDRWSLDGLRRQAYTHVVLAWPMGFRHQTPGLVAMPGFEVELEHTRQRYAQLYREAELVWQSDPLPPTPGYTNPLIRVYDIRMLDRGPQGLRPVP